MNNLFFLLASISISEFISLYYIKEYVDEGKIGHLVISVVFYGLMLAIFYKILKNGYGVGLTNMVWSILSILSGLFIGVILFNETILFHQKVGATIGLIGIIMVLWSESNDYLIT